MKIARSLAEIQRDPRSVVTVGSFDGVHLAHKEIIRTLVTHAAACKGRSVLVTFDPHPSEVVSSSRGPVGLLTTMNERIKLLSTLDIDLLFIVKFTFEFSQLTSQEFYQSYVVDRLGVSEVVVGYDHMFGRNREAGVQDLVKMGEQFSFSVHAADPYVVQGVTVSSTEIRSSLMKGDVDRAEMLLGYPYFLEGKVVPGDGRGKVLGYPTANIEVSSSRKLLPGHGVYLVGVQLEGEHLFGMMNVGIRPTVTDGTTRTVEVHVFDLDREIYGADMTVRCLRKLRNEQRFASVRELAVQLEKDKEVSLRHLAEYKR
jgi:riboflavin kinase/FMN adenylyltransferase